MFPAAVCGRVLVCCCNRFASTGPFSLQAWGVIGTCMGVYPWVYGLPGRANPVGSPYRPYHIVPFAKYSYILKNLAPVSLPSCSALCPDPSELGFFDCASLWHKLAAFPSVENVIFASNENG